MRKDAWSDDGRARVLDDVQVAALTRWVGMVAVRRLGRGVTSSNGRKCEDDKAAIDAAISASEPKRLVGRFPLPTMPGQEQRYIGIDIPPDMTVADLGPATLYLVRGLEQAERQRAGEPAPKPSPLSRLLLPSH